MTFSEWKEKFKKTYWNLKHQEIWDAAIEHGQTKIAKLWSDKYFDEVRVNKILLETLHDFRSELRNVLTDTERGSERVYFRDKIEEVLEKVKANEHRRETGESLRGTPCN